MKKTSSQTPLGYYDVFKDVADWSDETAQSWTTALNLRAGASDQRKLRKEIVNFTRLKAGETAIEIGCGTGALLCDLARAVGVGGRVVGFEPQTVFAEEARKRLAETKFSRMAEVREDSAENLSIKDAFADACVAQTVLIHLPDKVLKKALAEMKRVVKPGSGRVISCDQDGDTWTIDHPDRELTRRIVQFNSDQRYANGWTGRRLRRFFLEGKLENVEIKTSVHTDTEKSSYLFGMAERIAGAATEIGLINQKEQRKWIGGLTKSAERGNFFSSINYYICAGTRAAR